MGRTGGLSIPGGRGLPSIPGRGGLPAPGRVPRVEIEIPPRYADDVYDDAPRLPADPPRLPEPDAPRAPDSPRTPDAPRNPDTGVPWWVTAGLLGAGGMIASMFDQDGVTDTSGTADLNAEQSPPPGSSLPVDPRLSPLERRAKAGSDTAQRYLARKEMSDDLWRFKTLMAGGSHNIHSGNSGFLNQLYTLSDEDRAKALLQNMPINPLRAKIEEQNAENAMGIARSAMEQAARDSVRNPLQEAQANLINSQAEAALPTAERARRQVAAGKTRHPDVRQHALDIMHKAYSSPHAFGTRFTDNEVKLAATQLARDTGLDIGDATTIMKELQAERNGGLWSGVMGLLYDY